MQKSYLKYRLEKLSVTVQQVANNKFIIEYPRLKIQADTEEKAITQFKTYINEQLANSPTEEIDTFFNWVYLNAKVLAIGILFVFLYPSYAMEEKEALHEFERCIKKCESEHSVCGSGAAYGRYKPTNSDLKIVQKGQFCADRCQGKYLAKLFASYKKTQQ